MLANIIGQVFAIFQCLITFCMNSFFSVVWIEVFFYTRDDVSRCVVLSVVETKHTVRAAQLDWNPIGFQFQLDWIGKLVGKKAGKSGSVQLDSPSNWKMGVQLATGRQLVNWQNDWIEAPLSMRKCQIMLESVPQTTSWAIIFDL